jgi:hypothetical protein
MNKGGPKITSKETENTVLSFLKQTKDGKYAIIDKSSLEYSRVASERETVELVGEELHYSIR